MDELELLEAGDLFVDRFEIQQLLGEGDRKRTYLARDNKRDGLVALSVVKAEAVASDPQGTEREAKVLGRIGRHANIVSLYDYEIDRERALQYMEFEYLPGGTLGDYLKTHGPQSLTNILRFGRQIARGLNHLHSRGLLHRDVSPTNIWLDERGEAHLGDFDSAVPIEGAGELRPLTTNSFAAPEEQEGQSLDVRSDLFSLGGVLYVLATGGNHPGELEELCSARHDLPLSLTSLVERLLFKSPEERLPDAQSVLDALEEIRRAPSLDELIAAGESDNLEFKSSLYHLYGDLPVNLRRRVEQGELDRQAAEGEVRKDLRREITKTIAAFLNTNGGTLIIGPPQACVGEPAFTYDG